MVLKKETQGIWVLALTYENHYDTHGSIMLQLQVVTQNQDLIAQHFNSSVSIDVEKPNVIEAQMIIITSPWF